MASTFANSSSPFMTQMTSLSSVSVSVAARDVQLDSCPLLGTPYLQEYGSK